MKRIVLLSIALALLYSISSAQTIFKCTIAEKDVYDQHSEDILKLTKYRTDEEFLRLINRYYIPMDKRRMVKDYVRNREFHKVCLEYIYPDSLITRVQRKIRIDEVYQDSIDRVLIPFRDNRITGDNIALALHEKDYLNLDSAQYEYMLTKALDMVHRIRKDRMLNVWNEEMDILKRTLSKKQLDAFFKHKNSVYITKDVNDAWERICENGLAEQVDSAKEISLAVSYFNEYRKIKDLYRYYGTSQKKYLSELSKQMPLIVKMSDAIKKKERMADKNKRQEKVSKEFVW